MFFPLLRKYNFIQTVVNYRYAKLLNKYGKPLRVHIKIDTGMHRLGERAEHVKTITRIFQMKNLNIEGAFTHLCVSDSVSPKDKAYTESQGKAFYQVLSDLKWAISVLTYIFLQVMGLFIIRNCPVIMPELALRFMVF